MTQERLLKLAKTGVLTHLNREEEIKEEFESRTGRKSKFREIRIEELWEEYDEIEEMLKEFEK